MCEYEKSAIDTLILSNRKQHWFSMSVEEIEAHGALLEKLGVEPGLVAETVGILKSCLGDGFISLRLPVIPLLPIEMVLKHVDGEAAHFGIRPDMTGGNDPWHLRDYAERFDLIAVLLDMRGRQGEQEAIAAAQSVRKQADGLRARADSLPAQSADHPTAAV